MTVAAEATTIAEVTEDDLADLLPLVRAYCDFYGVAPADDDLLAVSRALIADPQREGLQLLARDGDGRPAGFATLFWSWSTLSAARKAILNDLFVVPDRRGSGLAEKLIEVAREHAREHGAAEMGWQTAMDNLRAQAVYERVGAAREEWLDYALPTESPHAERGPGETA